MNVLVALSTYSSPSSTALPRMPAGSEPALGSVRANPAKLPLLMISAKYCACSGVPARITLRSATKVVTKVIA